MVLTWETLLTCMVQAASAATASRPRPPFPGQQLIEPVRGMAGDAREDVGEPRLRIDAVHLGGDDEAVHGRGPPPSAIGAGEEAFLRLRAIARSFCPCRG